MWGEILHGGFDSVGDVSDQSRFLAVAREIVAIGLLFRFGQFIRATVAF